MPRFYYGSFEATLHQHMTSISKYDLAQILITSPYVNASDKNKNDYRADPDLDKSYVSKLRSGKLNLTAAILKKYRTDEALEYVKCCFLEDILPQILESERSALLQEVLVLIKSDETLSAETQSYFEKISVEKALDEFLSEAYLLAATQKLTRKKPVEEAETPNSCEELDKETTGFPPVEEILPTAKEIILELGQIFELKVGIIPKEAAYAPLNYFSYNTDILMVSSTGMLHAIDERDEKLRKKMERKGIFHDTVDVIIQAGNGEYAKKVVMVKFPQHSTYTSQICDINAFRPNYSIDQRARLKGTTEWLYTVEDAKIGDIVEFRILYRNLSSDVQRDVMISDVLPRSLCYIPSSTRLTNGNYLKGTPIDQDTLVTTGINIGAYESNTNGYVDFMAEVIDDGLQVGSNALVNWSQGTIENVILQDYTAVMINIIR